MRLNYLLEAVAATSLIVRVGFSHKGSQLFLQNRDQIKSFSRSCHPPPPTGRPGPGAVKVILNDNPHRFFHNTPGPCAHTMVAKKKTAEPKPKTRTVLVILSNRLDAFWKPAYLEVECDDTGAILSEKRLRTAPKDPKYDEVWENDEGRRDMATCHNFKRKFGHKLQKKR
jgi:hypothetical protein